MIITQQNAGSCGASRLRPAPPLTRLSVLDPFVDIPSDGLPKLNSNSKSKRKTQVEILVQQTLLNLHAADGPALSKIDVRMHVWEVPLWYRTIFPYEVRRFLRNASLKLSSSPTKLTLRPSLLRVAALGTADFAPTGVSFRKGIGLVGVCVARNDPTEFLVLDTENEQYRAALKSANEANWRGCGPDVTHNLSLNDAKRLAESYKQVVALVIRNLSSGEPIGCVTISTKSPSSESLRLAENDVIEDSLSTLASSIAVVIV